MQPQTKNKSKIFGSLFRFYRIQAGYEGDKGIVELASLLGKSRNTIYNWESSDMAPPNIPYDKVGELFGINPNRLKFPSVQLDKDEQPTLTGDNLEIKTDRIDTSNAVIPPDLHIPDYVREAKVAMESNEDIMTQCENHIKAFVSDIQDDRSRLHWTLVELQEHFPVGKFAKERRQKA